MKIQRFDFAMKGVVSIAMPKGAKVLHIEEQCGRVCLWALVDESAPTEAREFRLVGDGPSLDAECLRAKYVGTLQAPYSAYPVALHLFDCGGGHAAIAQADGVG